MHYKILAVLVVSLALTVVGVLAVLAGHWLIAVPTGWLGCAGLVLTFIHCAGKRNQELDEAMVEYERHERAHRQAA